MPTAVLDLEFENLPEELTGLEGYSRALILIRINGLPVGQSLISVQDGKIGNGDLKKELMEGANWSFWQYWLNNYLGIKDPRTNPTGPVPPSTVAVCTRDRTEDLKRCLDALVSMPDDGQEILVIDSCSSTDSTRKLAERYKGIRYIREGYPGLNIARNRALREASHSVVAFTDDDAVPDPNWLRSLLKNFEDPLVLCVTGLTMPLELETEAQEYFEKGGGFSRGFYRILYDSGMQCPHEAGVTGAGVNMALRKSILESIGPFDEALDAGTPTCSGGDTELFFRILSSGYRIVYDPAALNWHRHKRTWSKVTRYIYGYKVGEFAIHARNFIFEREMEAPLFAWRSIDNHMHSFKKPIKIFISELLGVLVGPWAYLYSGFINRKRQTNIK